MATQDYTPAAGDAQYPSYTGFTTQDPRTLTLTQAAALKPLVYGVQLNQIMCELLKHQELISGFTGFPWIEITDQNYTIPDSVATGTTFAFSNTDPDVNITLPAAASVSEGTRITLIPVYASTAPEVFVNPADTIKYVELTGTAGLILRPFNALTLISDGVDKWIVVAGIPDFIS